MIIKLGESSTLAKLIKENKNLMAFFYSERCSRCINTLPAVEKFAEQRADFLVVTIHVFESKFKELIESSPYNIRALPAVFVYQNGELIKEERGKILTYENLLEIANVKA